jgi:hypothetical protein
MSAESTPAPDRPLPPELRREPLALSDEELAAALRERLDEFNELWAMARARNIGVVPGLQCPLFGQPRLALASIAKKVPL